MSQAEDPKGKVFPPILNIGIALASQIGFVVVGIVLLAVFLGIWVDKSLSTKPIFTILFLVISGPVSLYLVMRLATSAVAKIQAPPKILGRGQTEEDEGGQKE